MQIDDVEIESLNAKVSSQVSSSRPNSPIAGGHQPQTPNIAKPMVPRLPKWTVTATGANGAKHNVSYEKEFGTLLSSSACEYFEQLSYQRAWNFLMDNEPEKRLDVRISAKRAGSCTLWRREISRLQYSAIDSRVIMNTVPTALHGLSAFGLQHLISRSVRDTLIRLNKGELCDDVHLVETKRRTSCHGDIDHNRCLSIGVSIPPRDMFSLSSPPAGHLVSSVLRSMCAWISLSIKGLQYM